MRLVPTPIAEAAELRVCADSSGFVLFEAPPGGAHLTPEQSLAVALDLIRVHAPQLLRAIEAAVRRDRLRLVGGDPGGDAA